jgi:hypothetical protein
MLDDDTDSMRSDETPNTVRDDRAADCEAGLDASAGGVPLCRRADSGVT